ncbi:hypothetical protein BD769DRAFT_1382534 [Suillus cothurnatus]|nr:hypothetical protein BD769DRAFT_1382534 [Suillus cothurnatus]
MPPEWTSTCNICGQTFKSRGLAAHQKACRRDAMRLQEDWERQNARAGSHPAPITHEPAYNEYVRPDEGLLFMLQQETPENECVLPPTFQLDNIKTEYHLHSGIAMKIDHFADFHRHIATCSQVPKNLTPWEPFSSCIDFDFVELVLKANLTKFSVTDYDGVCTMWDAASPHHAKFQKEVIFALVRILQDFMRFFDEPWTTNAFWDSQSSLPKAEGKPFAFIIYADKAKLLSFGCQKTYPVIAQCANLPVGICNGEGFGGGQLVGWLPIVKEDRKYSGTQSFVNFKNVVWHESFKCLLKSLAPLSKTGFWVKCWDSIERLFYPLILILSEDYEEQCVMALIRGTNCKCPCPVCLVPKDELGNVLTPYPFRTSAAVQATLLDARS